ncbi:helix-turn-helix domain-containing protein [Paenibacillus gansuensis]|uniref:Helix-turn-helix domain-containing protein n=1 Tax=Paenibacillus gansuensis TaxID=306542 RepID=A0ABW5PB24_9BACL
MDRKPALPNRWDGLYCLVGSSFGKYVCEPGWSWQPTPFHDFDLWYVLSGQGSMNVNGTNYPVQAGSFFIFQPGDRVIGEQNLAHPLTVLYCHFEISSKKDKAAVEEILSSTRHISFVDTSSIEPLLHQLIELANLQQNDETAVETDLLLKLIITRWNAEFAMSTHTLQARYHKKIMMQAQDYIRLHLSETIEYQQLAASVGYSPRYISKLMKDNTGLSLKETITKLRLERGLQLLTETAMSVTEISIALGYKDIYTFSKLFKRHYGFPPTFPRKVHLIL